MPVEDFVMMREGRMVVRINGLTTPMDEDIRMAEGIRVTADGEVVLADGTSRMLAEGEALTMDGRPARLEDLMEDT